MCEIYLGRFFKHIFVELTGLGAISNACTSEIWHMKKFQDSFNRKTFDCTSCQYCIALEVML